MTGYLSITNGFTPTFLAGNSPRLVSAVELPIRNLPPDSVTTVLYSSLLAQEMFILAKKNGKTKNVQKDVLGHIFHKAFKE